MWRYGAIVLCALAYLFPVAWAQEDTISTQDVIIVFSVFIAAVIALFLYLARDSIRRIRTDYDRQNFESQKNRDYEKYHSNWQDDYQEYASKRQNAPSLPNYYEILGVSQDATAKEIKARYRQMVKSLHPDISGKDSDTDMAKINEAYETLSDKKRRAKYDSDIGARGEI